MKLTFNYQKAAIALICSSFLLTGCLDSKNNDDSPSTEDPVTEEPTTEEPTTEEPTDPGVQDGELAQPYAEGIKVYEILESTGANSIVREDREVSGATVNHIKEEKTTVDGTWAASASEKPWMILSESATSTSFKAVSPESYDLDTSMYQISINNTDFLANIEHRYYAPGDQTIKDFITVNVQAPTLASSINDTDTFDGSVIIYEELYETQQPFTAYFPGPSNEDGTSCLDISGSNTSESISTSGNCNIITDGAGSGYTDLANMVGTDAASAPIVEPNSVLEIQLKLVSSDGTIESGQVLNASDDSVIGDFYKNTFEDGKEYITLDNIDTSSASFYNIDHIDWSSTNGYHFVRDNQRIRMVVDVPFNIKTKNKGHLLNENGINQIDGAYTWAQ